MSPAAASPEPEGTQLVKVDGRQLALKRLDKVLYPESGTTKAEVLDYYARIAPVLLRYLADRPVTRIRWPDGVGTKPFFEKNIPAHAPSWLSTVVLPTPGSSRNLETLRFPLLTDTAALIWAVNLAALELHVPQWTVGPRGGVRNPNRLVIDLDPGAPAGLAECAEAANLIAERLTADGLSPVPVTSGSKGLHLYAPLASPVPPDEAVALAKEVAESLEAEHGSLVTSTMTKARRRGKVFIDWSQNSGSKTTVCPYSLRATPRPQVATPVTWDEVSAGAEDPLGLEQFSPAQVLARIEDLGDLLA